MGDVVLPSVDGGIGSGDMLGGTAEAEDVAIQEPEETITMKKFNKIKEEREINEKEIYIPISDFGDTANLIESLAAYLMKRTNVRQSEMTSALQKLLISYNGLVDVKSVTDVAKLLEDDNVSVKKKIDKFLDKNIYLLEDLQVQLMTKILTDPSSINESILGRALGGVAGFALGPKVGKIIAKVLGITKGPLYNVLTSRIVSAALAQELTKNLI